MWNPPYSNVGLNRKIIRPWYTKPYACQRHVSARERKLWRLKEAIGAIQ